MPAFGLRLLTLRLLTLRLLTMTLVLCAVSARPARAQESPAIEVTPFVALGSIGSSPIGAAITFPVTSNLSVEAEVGYRRGEGDMSALNMNASLLYDLPRIGRVKPYLAAGVGLAQYGRPVVLPNVAYPIGTEPRLTTTVNAGGGIRVPVNDSWGMRTDARWFKSFGRDASEQFRVAQGISFDVGKR
jgi:hypothetical protein